MSEKEHPCKGCKDMETCEDSCIVYWEWLKARPNLAIINE